MTQTPAPRRRHLMDPNAPRQPRDTAAENRSLSNVQRWVMSVLAVTTVFHLVLGLLIAAYYLDSPRPGAQIGLCLISAVLGMIGVGLGLIIHKRSPLSPWLLLGVIPSAVAIWLIER